MALLAHTVSQTPDPRAMTRLARGKDRLSRVVSRRAWARALGMMAAVSLLALGSVVGAPAASAAPALGLTMTAVGSAVVAGENTTYQIAWSCSSVSEACDAGTITVPIPKLQPTNVTSTVYITGTASTGGFSATPTVASGVITWKMSGSIPAGSSGQMNFTVRVPNMASPNGSTVDPVATFAVTGASQTATATKTVESATAMITDKRIIGSSTPGLDVPVTYSVSTMHASSLNPNTGVQGFAPKNGTWALENVVTVDDLPVGAEFISATGGGSYDSGTHKVTWPAWSENGVGAPAPAYQVTVRYPSTVFTTASIVTNNASATANPYLHPDETVTSNDVATHGFIASIDRGLITKAGSLARPNGGTRGAVTAWQIAINNSGTSPLAVDFTDPLPCVWSSPTDGSTSCANPAVKNVSLQLTGGQTGVIYAATYTTNLGNTGSVNLATGQAASVLAPQSATEWVTQFGLTGVIPAGNSVSVSVTGTVVADLPTDSSDASYHKPNVPKGSPVFIENCLSGKMSTLAGTVVTDVVDACGYVKVLPDRPVFRVGKVITDGTQGVGGQMTVALTMETAATRMEWHPVLADLLPADLRYVPGSATSNLLANAKPYLPDANFSVEVIDNYNNTGRQLVRVSWPGAPGLPGVHTYRGDVKFKVEVQPGAEVGTRTNDVMSFDENYVSHGTDAKPSFCFASTSTLDTNNLAGHDDPASIGCLASAPYSIIASPAIGGTKWVKGSADDDFLAAPSVGVVLAGLDADYRLDVTNTGNVPIKNVVAYEILPHVGDTGVGPAAGGSRSSEWQTLLSGDVTTDIPAEISYSTSTNPCRGEVMSVGGARADGPAGCVDDWSTTLPADASTIRSIRVDFGDKEFGVGEVHPVTIPVDVPKDASGIAWNSFALAANEASTGKAVLPVEPNKVGLRAEASLKVGKTASTLTAKRNGQITWNITLENDGSGQASGVVVVDQLPEYLEYVSSTSTNGSYDPESQQWVLATAINAGDPATLSIVTKVRENAPLGELCNLASAYLGSVEDDPISESSFCITVIPTPVDPTGPEDPEDPPVVTPPVVDQPVAGDPAPAQPAPATGTLASTGFTFEASLAALYAALGLLLIGGGLLVQRRIRKG